MSMDNQNISEFGVKELIDSFESILKNDSSKFTGDLIERLGTVAQKWQFVNPNIKHRLTSPTPYRPKV